MYRGALLSVFILFSCFLFGQENIDALIKQLNSTKDDTSRAQILMELVDEITDDNVWPQYNQQALDIAEENIPSASGKTLLALQKIRADAYLNLGYNYKNIGEIVNALKYYNLSLQAQEK